MHFVAQNESQTQAEASTSQAAPLKMTLAAKEDSLTTLVSDNWLGRTEDGMVCLGIKSFLELRSLFKNFDVPFCDVCNEAAIKVFHIVDFTFWVSLPQPYWWVSCRS